MGKARSKDTEMRQRADRHAGELGYPLGTQTEIDDASKLYFGIFFFRISLPGNIRRITDECMLRAIPISFDGVPIFRSRRISSLFTPSVSLNPAYLMARAKALQIPRIRIAKQACRRSAAASHTSGKTLSSSARPEIWVSRWLTISVGVLFFSYTGC